MCAHGVAECGILSKFCAPKKEPQNNAYKMDIYWERSEHEKREWNYLWFICWFALLSVTRNEMNKTQPGIQENVRTITIYMME